MPNATVLLVSSSAADAVIDADNRSWVEVLVTTNGEVAQNHGKFILTRDDLETCANQIRANADKLPLDYDHSYVENGNTVASGWFTGEAQVLAKDELRPNGSASAATKDELWAEVEWTPQAVSDIKAKRYRFISAEFRFSENVKGVSQKVKEFVAATLTNRPFFNRLEAVTLSRVTASVVWDTSAGFEHIRDRLAAALNPPDAADGDVTWRYWVRDVDVPAMKALVEDSTEATTYVVPFTVDADGEPVPAPQADWAEAEQQWVTAAREAEERHTKGGPSAANIGGNMPTDRKALADALGLPEDATDEQLVTAAQAAKGKATATASKPDVALAQVREALGLDENADEAAVIVAARAAREASVRLDTADDELETLRGADAERTKLKERVKALEDERLTEKTKRILTEGVREGQVLPAEKAVLAKQFATNPDGLLEIIATRPKRHFAAIGTGGDANDSESVRGIRQQFESKEADGVDTESAVLHARATQILAEQGKRKPTELEYAEALELAAADSY